MWNELSIGNLLWNGGIDSAAQETAVDNTAVNEANPRLDLVSNHSVIFDSFRSQTMRNLQN